VAGHTVLSTHIETMGHLGGSLNLQLL